MTIVLQLIYRFSAIYIKILMDFFKNKDDDLKIYIEIQGTQNSQNNLEEKTCWRTHISQFQNLSQNSNNQDHIALAWGRHIDPGNRIEKPEMKPYMYGQLTFRRVPRQSNTKKKKQSFQQMMLGQLDIHAKEWIWTPISYYIQELTQKQITNQNYNLLRRKHRRAPFFL